jgi:hypothetical protein
MRGYHHLRNDCYLNGQGKIPGLTWLVVGVLKGKTETAPRSLKNQRRQPFGVSDPWTAFTNHGLPLSFFLPANLQSMPDAIHTNINLGF